MKLKPLRTSLVIIGMILCTMVTCPYSSAQATQKHSDAWQLVWKDEFNGDKGKIDTSKWVAAPRKKSDWNNYMSSESSLYIVSNGTIKLMGVVNKDKSTDKADYLTAGLISKGKFNFKYGKIEIRAKFKSAKGAWPALWMLGATQKYGGWPYKGEIDLMEHLNYDNKVYQTVHSYYTQKQGGKNKPKSSLATKIDHTKFNTYGMEWDDSKLVLLVNGKPTLTYPRLKDKGKYQYPFDAPMYLLLTMQIEGNWVGKAEPSDYPAWMEVDWVRVWQKAPKEKLAIVSYNIRHGVNMQNKLQLDDTAALLKTLAADVIALQEVDKKCGRSGKIDQAAFLAKKLGMHHAFGKFMNYDGGEYGQAILSKFPILETKVHQLPRGAEPRVALEVVVEPVKGLKVSFVCIHFDYTSEKRRQPQIKALLEALKAVKHPVILIGDFNALPESNSISLFKKEWFNVPKNGDPHTFPANAPDQEIDYFMLRGWRTDGVICEVINEKNVSDHRPLKMTIDIPKAD